MTLSSQVLPSSGLGVPGSDDLGSFIEFHLCPKSLDFFYLSLLIRLFPYWEYLLYASCLLELCPLLYFRTF
jgi:hypothetical protein